ncbi:hypothetical protein B0H14DRAFT_3093238 [Mycena olivaceomarginata]|nr:hypothetical protein B0H14DRAFT_3093238 [Mycena olivaceomarginata]
MGRLNRADKKSKPAQMPSASTHTFNVADLITPAEAIPVTSFVDRASGDGQSIVRQAVRVNPPSPLKRARLGEYSTPLTEAGPPNSADNVQDDRYTMAQGDNDYDDPPVQPLPRLPNPKRLEPSDCAGGVLLCKACVVDKHVELPLHVIYEWNGIFFTKSSLRDAGLRIQFGHLPRERCAHPQPGNAGFVVLHNNGIHTVNIDFCGCDSAMRADPYIQLLRAGWYPATDERPQTAATFSVLDTFHLHTLQAKTTAYDFYAVLERLTDVTGLKPPNRYQVFLRMMRQYCHLLMLKRAGRGHDRSGVWGTAAGELAVECPVCPNPQVNLPEGWEDAPPADQFLYILFIALDACFRLKQRMISSEIKDPGLGTSWAYVTENLPYRHYPPQGDRSEGGNGLAALDYANTKFSRGYSTTGVGMGVCARHEFVQPNGVGDLQKGERFTNMDYIFGSILHHKDPRLRKIISYDIVCQWWKFLLERMANLPPLVCITIILRLFRFVIPKMHIHAHTLDCHGQTDGEGIERPWASIGAIASSTRVSGPGARHDALDDHWNFWNWLKTIGLPAILHRRLDAAKKEAASQRVAFETFTLQQADRVQRWKQMVEEFEADATKKNPYEMKITGLTEMEVRLQFAKDEEEGAKLGVPALHEVTPSGFIAAGLELEEQQRRVRVQAELKKAGTTGQQINMHTLRSKLNRGIARFRTLQATYTPAAIQALAKRVAPAEELAEQVPLMLPSSLSAAERGDGGCAKGVLEVEDSLREAQYRTALPRLRNQLHIKSQLLLYKKHNTRHQGMNTCSRTIKFQMAWQARLRIAGDALKVGWPQLKKEDIQCMQDAEEVSRNAEKRCKARQRRLDMEDEMREDGLLPQLGDDNDEMTTRGGENMREISWIWTSAGTAGMEEELEDALRIEWSKAWVRSRCWTEEVRLLEEEWRRLPVSYAHCEKLWVDRAVAVPVTQIPAAEAEGMIAYAMKQAQMYRDLAERAEVTRTEVQLAKGKKRAVWQPSWDPVIGIDGHSGAAEGDDDNNEADEDGDDDERGDIESDEELLMGGEVDD